MTSSSPASNFLNPSNSSVFLGKSAFICDPDLDHIVPLAPLVDTVPSQATDIITHSLYQSIPPNSVPSFSPTSVNSDGSVHSSVSSPVSYFVPADEVRRSVRHWQASSYLQGYACSLNLVISPHLLDNVLSYDHLSQDQKSFVMNIRVIEEPKYYHEAAEKPEQQQAIQQEL